MIKCGSPCRVGLWHSIAALLLLAVSAVSPLQAEIRDAQSHFFQETFYDFTEELALAQEEGKKGVLLFFEMDECPFCHYMKETILNRSEVQDYFREHFRIFSVDIEGDVEITDFSGAIMKQKEFATKAHRVRATPVTAFFDLEGQLVHRFTGKTSGVEEFLLMGRFVAEQHYKNERFVQFKRRHRQ
ncbi:thioredoxin [Ectothiorhodospiraceae bacterium BW-2]|nr:thioredoxin [Ectothiorhodospiraceae bacterium BW-2]